MDKKITIYDVAQQSGVSVSTVSLVLNNRPGVAQETRHRVFEISERLGYAQKTTLQANKNVRLTTVGMIIKQTPWDLPPRANPFYSRVIVGIEEACRRKGINLLFAVMPVDVNNRLVEVPTLLQSDDLDGLLMVGAFVDETISEVSAHHSAKIVLVDAYSDSRSFDTVVSDNFRAAYQAVEYLIHKGHRHIGLVGSESSSYPSVSDRRNGYLRALKENGISDVYIANFNVSRTHGGEETSILLKENPQITALFGINDEIAVTAMYVAQALDRQVPKNLSVIGYDDTYPAAFSSPPLTTMHVDTLAMGHSAVQLLALRLENPDMACMTLTIHPTLVERGSVVELIDPKEVG